MLDEVISLNAARKLKLISAFLLALQAGCSGDGTTDPVPPPPPPPPPASPVATTIVANSEAALSGVAGSVVSPTPSVIVRDQFGAPFPGAPVTFSVQSG